MKGIATFACIFCLPLLLPLLGAAAGPRDLRGYDLVDGRYGAGLTGEPVGSGAKADTLVIHQVDFQDAAGAPSRDGWTSVDRTRRNYVIWHVDTFNCANLDPLTVPNHAWWCGESTFATCLDGYGYGNGYDEWLDWWGDVPDPLLPTTVGLTAMLNYDNEPGYDYLYLQVEGAAGFLDLRTWNGIGTEAVSETFSVPVADYRSNPDGGAKAVHLRWRATSDTGWSDQDCLWPTSGHSQIDLIRVTFDQGGGPVQIGPVEDCEGPARWVAAFPPGVGDFAKVWPLLHDIDPCGQNNTPQFAFVDDGVVVPGTGGTPCISWCYGPGGWIVNHTGGLAGPSFHLDNEIWSPPFAFPAGYDGCWLQFLVWRHHSLLSWDDPGILYQWGVRSINDAAPNPAWSGWRDLSYVYYGGPDYLWSTYVVTALLQPGRTRMQVEMGALEIGWVWGYEGSDGTPAPYFDDVKVLAFTYDGPALSTQGEIRLAQDDFPASGVLDHANLGNNSVRFDMAANIALAAELKNQPGDSIWIDASPVRAGTALAGPPQMVYKLKPNPLFDPYRTSGLPNSGVVVGDTTKTSAGYVINNRFDFDLPDESFFFPGDMIHYFFKATDNLGGTTLMPGDTTGFSFFPGDAGYRMLRYPSSYTVRALPYMISAVPGDQPRKLFWNDFGNRGGEQEWMHALYSCGYVEGVNLDVYHTNGPTSGVGNGLGGRATASQLAGYDAILYSSGDLASYTITGVDYANDPGDDVGVLDSWLRQGGKGLLLTGDQLVFNLNNTGGPAGAAQLAFEDTWIQVASVGRSVRPLIGMQATPTVARIPAVGVFWNATRWIANGSCPGINQFDAVTVQGSAVKAAEFLTITCGSSAYNYAAAVYTPNPAYDAKVLYLPYDLMNVIYDTRCGGSASTIYSPRAQILRDAILLFGNPVSTPLTDVPEAPSFAAAVSPNPFNPVTTVKCTMPGKGHLRVRVYDVRGRLVSTLQDGVVEAGTREVAWDAGTAVSSGVYFVQVQSDYGSETIKAALVK